MREEILENKADLELKLRGLMDHFTGLNSPLSEYVYDEEGKLSEAKVDELISELIGIMYDNWYYQYDNGMSGAKKVCIEQFLYLAIMSHRYGDNVKTFRNILSLLEDDNIVYSNLFDLYKDEVDEYKNPPRGFFGKLHENYEELSGHTILEDMSVEDRPIIEGELGVKDTLEKYRQQQESIYAEYEKQGIEPIYRREATYEEMLGIEYDVPSDYIEDIDPETGELHYVPVWNKCSNTFLENAMKRLDTEYIVEVEKKEEEALAIWKESIKEPARFLQACRDFRKLYFVVGINRKELEETFIRFLSKHGKGKLDNTDKVNELYVTLARAKKMSDRI